MNEQTLKAALKNEAAASALVGLIFDHVTAQPVSQLLRPERILAHIDAALDEGALERQIDRHLRPWFDREAERLDGRREERVRDWLTAEAIAELRALAAKPVQLDKAQIERFVHQPGVKQMITSVVKETIERFISALNPSNLFGGGRRGLGLMGGITGQFEAQIQRVARSFIDTSMESMLTRVAQLMASPETARQLGRMKLSGFESTLERRICDLWQAGADALPRDDLLEILPGLIAHNLSRPALRDALLDEVKRWLEIEGDRPLGEVMADMNLRDVWRQEIVEIAGPLLGGFAEGDAFNDWIAQFVAPA